MSTFILIQYLACMECTWCHCLHHHGYSVVPGLLVCYQQVSIFLTSKCRSGRLNTVKLLSNQPVARKRQCLPGHGFALTVRYLLKVRFTLCSIFFSLTSKCFFNVCYEKLQII